MSENRELQIQLEIILLALVLVFSMAIMATSVLAPVVISEPGGSIVEVPPGDEFMLRFMMRWDEEAKGYYALSIDWFCPENNPAENFTFLSASAYFDNLKAIDATVNLYEGSVGNGTKYNVVVSNATGDPRNGEFNVDMLFRAAGVGGVPHIATENHPMHLGTISVYENTLLDYAPPNPYITVRVLAPSPPEDDTTPSPPEDDTTPPPSDTTPPPTPSLASPTNGASIPDNTPPLNWSDVSDTSGVTYDLFIARDAGFASIALQKTGLSDSTYELTPVEALAAGTYYWHVRGVDGVGNVGSWSEKWSFTIYVSLAPATLTASTTPIKASVYVDNVFWGIAPQTRSLVAGSYTVSFGGYLGYLTPPPQTVTLAAGETRIVTGTYTEIPPELIENESPPVDIPSITKDENATIEVENTAITGMTIDVGENVENVRITVQQLTDKPPEIAIGPPGVTYCYLNIASENIIDAGIGTVLINFRVEKAWITAENIKPDSIVMRRWEPKLSGMWDPVAEVWVSLPTARIGEDGTCHYYRAESPGLSIFGITGLTLAPSPVEFEVSSLVIDPSEVRPGEAITISVSVTNDDDLEGTYTVTLEIANVVEATENVTLAGGATETVTFTVSRDVEGTYGVEVDGLAGTFVVALHASLPIVPPLAITGGIVLLAGTLIWLRRRRTKKGGNRFENENVIERRRLAINEDWASG